MPSISNAQIEYIIATLATLIDESKTINELEPLAPPPELDVNTDEIAIWTVAGNRTIKYTLQEFFDIIPEPIASLVEGANITIDATDPENPIISSNEEWLLASGTKAGNDIVLIMGDFNDSGNGERMRWRQSVGILELRDAIGNEKMWVMKTEIRFQDTLHGISHGIVMPVTRTNTGTHYLQDIDGSATFAYLKDIVVSSLTTTGTGPATLIGGVLNIPVATSWGDVEEIGVDTTMTIAKQTYVDTVGSLIVKLPELSTVAVGQEFTFKNLGANKSFLYGYGAGETIDLSDDSITLYTNDSVTARKTVTKKWILV